MALDAELRRRVHEALEDGQHDAPDLESEDQQTNNCSTTHETPARRRIGRPKGSGGNLSPTSKRIREAVLELTEQYNRMTVRQVFYALTVRGVVPKTENLGYRPVQRQVLAMRHGGLIPWDFIADGTRIRRQLDTWDDAEDFIEEVRRSYRRNRWQGQGFGVEVWLEKDALAEVILPVINKWRVPLMVSRGQSSATYLHSAAMYAKRCYERNDDASYIYALYDYDGGGDRASRAIATQLPAFAGEDVPIYFERLALAPAQIIRWNLPLRPPKPKDPEAKKWAVKSLAEIGRVGAVELDAIPLNLLMGLVENAIKRHINTFAWDIERQIEEEERKGLGALRMGPVDKEDDDE